MRLSTKLKISFCIFIILPAILFSGAVIGVIKISVLNIEEEFGATDTSYTALANPVALVSKMCESQYNKLLDSSLNSPGDLENKEYLDYINKELLERNSYLIVIKDDKCIYSGKEDCEEVISALAGIDFGYNTSVYLNEQGKLLVDNIKYMDADGLEGNAFVVMQIVDILPQVRNLLIDGMVSMIVILVLTSGLFVYWAYRTMVNPINKLKLATHNIKNGNLDFDMNVTGQDEISELCRDFDDMRERLKENAEEKVRTDAKSKELISNISHDLKTPITAIKGYVEGIMDGVADDKEKMDRYIRTIYNKACEMDTLIDELTFYSKVDSDKVVYNFSKVNIQEYFYSYAEELSLELSAEGIELIFENNLTDDAETVLDAEQFRRALSNIISNSVKYMNHEDGIIRILITDMNRQFGIDICDNGPGIDKKDIPYVFDRFYRADSSRNSANGGSGIGLSIVKKIIYDHNGTIEAHSVEGEGTVMHIVLDKYSGHNSSNA